jgi:hypothetical protein
MANAQRPPADPSPLAQLLKGAMRFLSSFFTIFVINLEDQLVKSPPRKLVVQTFVESVGTMLTNSSSVSVFSPASPFSVPGSDPSVAF